MMSCVIEMHGIQMLYLSVKSSLTVSRPIDTLATPKRYSVFMKNDVKIHSMTPLNLESIVYCFAVANCRNKRKSLV